MCSVTWHKIWKQLIASCLLSSCAVCSHKLRVLRASHSSLLCAHSTVMFFGRTVRAAPYLCGTYIYFAVGVFNRTKFWGNRGGENAGPLFATPPLRALYLHAPVAQWQHTSWTSNMTHTVFTNTTQHMAHHKHELRALASKPRSREFFVNLEYLFYHRSQC